MQEIRQRFQELVAAGDDGVTSALDTGALLIAKAVDPSVVIEDQRQRLDRLAATTIAESPTAVAHALFAPGSDPHFRGNPSAYYDPENSLLHRVLDRRLGIPISLALLMIEVGRRKGVDVHGVGMPGHFLVGSADGFIDVFHGGVVLDAPGCAQLFERLAGPGATLPHDALDRTPSAMILKRMLFNLAAIGANEQNGRLVRSSRSLLAAFPDASGQDHVQHAYAAAAIGQFSEAAAAGEQARDLVPDSVRTRLSAQITQWEARLN